jgi:hypothetical protein
MNMWQITYPKDQVFAIFPERILNLWLQAPSVRVRVRVARLTAENGVPRGLAPSNGTTVSELHQSCC